MAKRSDQLIGPANIGDRTIQLVETMFTLDLDDLRGENERVGALSGWFAEWAARAKRRAGDLELALEVTTAALALEKRQHLVRQGEKSTEDHIKNLVRTDPRYAEAYRAWLDAQEVADKVESAKFTVARNHENLGHFAPLLFSEMAARRGPRELPQVESQPPVRTPMRRN